MTLPLYRMSFVRVCSRVLYGVSYFNSWWRRENFRRTFSSTTCVLLTLTRLKPMGARDYLSVLVHTLTVIKRRCAVCQSAVATGYTTGFAPLHEQCQYPIATA